MFDEMTQENASRYFIFCTNECPGLSQHHSQRQPGIKSDTKYEKTGDFHIPKIWQVYFDGTFHQT